MDWLEQMQALEQGLTVADDEPRYPVHLDHPEHYGANPHAWDAKRHAWADLVDWPEVRGPEDTQTLPMLPSIFWQ